MGAPIRATVCPHGLQRTDSQVLTQLSDPCYVCGKEEAWAIANRIFVMNISTERIHIQPRNFSVFLSKQPEFRNRAEFRTKKSECSAPSVCSDLEWCFQRCVPILHPSRLSCTLSLICKHDESDLCAQKVLLPSLQTMVRATIIDVSCNSTQVGEADFIW